MPARSVCLVTLSPSEAGPGRFGRQQSSIPPLSLSLCVCVHSVVCAPCMCRPSTPSPFLFLSCRCNWRVCGCLRSRCIQRHAGISQHHQLISDVAYSVHRLLHSCARPLPSLPLFLSVCCARAHACVHMCVRCVCMCWSVCNSACACACVCVCVFQPRIGRLFRVSTLSGGEEHGGAGHLWQAISWMIGCCENNKD
jgi:hypothetical protein